MKNNKNVLTRSWEAIKHAVGIQELDLSGSTVGRPEDRGFRRLSQKSDKELSPLEWKRQMAIAHYLWLTNPLAQRIIELTNDFVVGDGYTVTCDYDNVSAVIEAHWNDPDNAWDMKQFTRAQELSLFGSILFRPFVNTANGHVKLSPVDPAWVVELIGDPNVAGQVDAVKLKIPGKDEETLKVIRKDNVAGSPTEGKLVGDIFYFAINKLEYTLQGLSDLFRVADWLDGYDQYLFHCLERIVFLNAHLYDITIENGTADQVKERAAELEANPPKSGGFRVHNQQEKWEALAPKINSGEVAEMCRTLKLMILGAVGIPEHWVADGGETNLATAAEMGTPILRKLKRRQAEYRDIIRFVLDYQLDQAQIAGKLPADAARDYELVVPQLSNKDAKALADTLVSLTDSLIAAVSAKFTDQATAAKLWRSQAGEFGVDVEPEAGAEVWGPEAGDPSHQPYLDAEKKWAADGGKGQPWGTGPKPKGWGEGGPGSGRYPKGSGGEDGSGFAKAGDVVDGRTVIPGVANTSSIAASLTNYEILPGIREVPFSEFTQMGKLSFYSKDEEDRTSALAQKIKDSKTIAPLIVVMDNKGPYILEGGHRFDALRMLKAKSFPALVVKDLDSLASK